MNRWPQLYPLLKVHPRFRLVRDATLMEVKNTLSGDRTVAVDRLVTAVNNRLTDMKQDATELSTKYQDIIMNIKQHISDAIDNIHQSELEQLEKLKDDVRV